MDDKKVKNTKKTLNIKNKKVATKTLAKSSIKGKTTPKNKKTNIKKVKISKEKVKKVEELENKELLLESELKKKQDNNIPNNIKRKIPKENNIKKKDKKKEKKTKEKSKTKIELPKEWKIINQKNKSNSVKNENKNKPLEQTQGIKNKLKNSIFEEVEEQTLIERKKKGREKLKRNFIITLILISIISVIVVALLKYNDFVKKSLAVYDVYRIGDKVKLENETVWYVIKDSDSKESNVLLLSSSIADVNGDSAISELDRLKFNKESKVEYDVNDEESVAYFLKNNYKKYIEDGVGSVEEVRLLTSKEYVKIRERMGYGYEWSESNWLANSSYSRWWLNSNQNDKIYLVTAKGTYSLVKADTLNYVRPVVEIKKEKVNRLEEQRKMRVDLVDGLK